MKNILIEIKHCKKCNDLTKFHLPYNICTVCGYAEEKKLDFIKTKDIDMDLLK